MKILIDTNVLLDIFQKREPFFPDSYQALHGRSAFIKAWTWRMSRRIQVRYQRFVIRQNRRFSVRAM